MKAIELRPIQMIPLERARLCVTCNLITDQSVCPCCVSDYLWPVQAWLDRKEVTAHESLLQ